VGQEDRSIARFKEQEALVRETLSGYARAADVMEQERMERLARMTPEEARAVYDDLCRSWAARRESRDLERLERWRLETLLSVRAAMARLARAAGDGQ